mgnify:CR=1 FL=1
MTFRDVWTDNAILGVREVGKFINEHQQGGGAAIVGSIFDRVAEVLDFPESAPAHPTAGDPRVRRLVYRKYVIIYRILDERRIVEVLSVRHQRQRPMEPDELP